MKKTRLLTTAVLLCFAASLFTGCNTPADESAEVSRIGGGQTQISVDASGAGNQSSADYKFSYKGCDIAPRVLAQPILDVLGTPVSFDPQAAGCGGQGLYATYYYPSFYIQTYEENDGEIVAFVVITDGLVDCGGVRVGDTHDVVKQVYGTPAEEDDFGITYRSGYVDLHFVTDGVNTVTEIQYQDNNQ